MFGSIVTYYIYIFFKYMTHLMKKENKIKVKNVNSITHFGC